MFELHSDWLIQFRTASPLFYSSRSFKRFFSQGNCISFIQNVLALHYHYKYPGCIFFQQQLIIKADIEQITENKL